MDIKTKFQFTGGYINSTFNFGLCSRPIDGVVHSTEGPSFSCREYLCSQVSKYLENTSYHKSRTFGTDRLRMLVYSKVHRGEILPAKAKASAKAKCDQLKTAVRLINSLEKNVGWSLTKAYRIKNNVYSKKPEHQLTPGDILYMVVGNAKWMRSPVLISMYGALLRSGHNTIIKKNATVSTKEVFPKVVKTMRRDGSDYLKTVVHYAIPFLLKFDAMFNRRSMKFNYSGERLGMTSNTGTEGFHKLANGTTRDEELYKRFEKNVIPLAKKQKR